MRTRRGTRAAAGLALVALGLLSACGTSHKADQATMSACLDRVQARSDVAVVNQFYRDGKLGSAAKIRGELQQLRPLKLAFPITSFLRADGTMPTWDQMSSKQQLTFEQWLGLPRVADVVSQPTTEASLRATERARTTTCAPS
jgi:hypothetical protein